MYHPTTRLLTILELLQAHPLLSGAELARRLEVEPRSIRRYIQMLQDMGMPVEATYGPGGGYRLRPSFKLPPLLFTEEEATAIALSLLGTAWLEIGMSSVAIEGALAKVARVLPERARERLNAVTTHLMLSPHTQDARPDAALLIELSDAIQQRRRVEIDYRSYSDEITSRTVEPYGMTGWIGRWYLAAYCCMRQDYRLFRLDRIQRAGSGIRCTDTYYAYECDMGMPHRAFVREVSSLPHSNAGFVDGRVRCPDARSVQVIPLPAGAGSHRHLYA
jgi:predicted DNA-binding transcriptional regulator YafY